MNTKIIELTFMRDLELKDKGRGHVTISKVVKKELDRHCNETKTKQSEFVTKAVIEALIKEEEKKEN